VSRVKWVQWSVKEIYKVEMKEKNKKIKTKYNEHTEINKWNN